MGLYLIFSIMSLLPDVVFGNLIIFWTVPNSACSRLVLAAWSQPSGYLLLLWGRSFFCPFLMHAAGPKAFFPNGQTQLASRNCPCSLSQSSRNSQRANSPKHRVALTDGHDNVFFDSSEALFLLLSIFLLSFPLL